MSGLLPAYNQLTSDQNGMLLTTNNTENTWNARGHILMVRCAFCF